MHLIQIIMLAITYCDNFIKIYRDIERIFDNQLLEYRRKKRNDELIIMQARIQMLKLLQVSLSNEKVCWVKERWSTFWEVDCQQLDELSFKNHFRLSRKSFEKLVNLMQNFKKEDTHFRQAIPLEKRIAISLYALGSYVEYSVISNLFGVGKSTVCELLHKFCLEAWNALQPLYLDYLPLTKSKIEECRNGFDLLGFPQVLGALDGCHIEIRPAKEDAEDYLNEKGWYSTTLLALVDHRQQFLYIDVGGKGNCGDAECYEHSSLNSYIAHCDLLNEMSSSISNVDVPILMLADSAFQLMPNLMKPYAYYLGQSEIENNFNQRLTKCRKVADEAFENLKARFRRIGKGINSSSDKASIIIKTCCVLHNFCNEENESINGEWLDEQRMDDTRRPQPQTMYPILIYDPIAAQIRAALASHFSAKCAGGNGGNEAIVTAGACAGDDEREAIGETGAGDAGGGDCDHTSSKSSTTEISIS